MKAYFKTCELEDGDEDLKEAWSVGEACVAKLGSEWYRAQVIADNGTMVAVIFVDLGNVRKVAYRDLRIAREVPTPYCMIQTYNNGRGPTPYTMGHL